MHMDPLMPILVSAAFLILLIGLIMRKLNQPHVIAYLLAGIIIGPSGFALFKDTVLITRLGDFGVILLLFFVGMEVSLPKLFVGWRIAIIGTFLQILASIGCVFLIGYFLEWSFPRIILFGFAISLSSTAVVISILRHSNQLDSEMGNDVLGILLVQDLAIIPMLMILGLFSGEKPSLHQLGLQFIGALLSLFLLIYLFRKKEIKLPFISHKILKSDHELQVFLSFLLCFGFAMLTALLELSTALGAFFAGIVVASAKETDWISRSLEPFRVLFVALFFVAVGMLIDLQFFLQEWKILLLLVLATFFTNTFINAIIIHLLGRTWPNSFYAGTLLAQIGEFSFVLAAIGRQSKIISEFAYQGTIAIIAISLFFSPAWIFVSRKIYLKFQNS